MKNWKTSLGALLLAVLIGVQPIIETGVIDWKKITIAALIAAIGFVAKDNNVTGGTKQQ